MPIFALYKTAKGRLQIARSTNKNEMNIEDLKNQLDRIEQYARMSAKNVLSLEEVSIITGLSKSHLYKLTCTSQIPYYKRGKLLWFDKNEVEAWMKQNRHNTTFEAEREAVNFILEKGGLK